MGIEVICQGYSITWNGFAWNKGYIKNKNPPTRPYFFAASGRKTNLFFTWPKCSIFFSNLNRDTKVWNECKKEKLIYQKANKSLQFFFCVWKTSLSMILMKFLFFEHFEPGDSYKNDSYNFFGRPWEHRGEPKCPPPPGVGPPSPFLLTAMDESKKRKISITLTLNGFRLTSPRPQSQCPLKLSFIIYIRNKLPSPCRCVAYSSSRGGTPYIGYTGTCGLVFNPKICKLGSIFKNHPKITHKWVFLAFHNLFFKIDAYFCRNKICIGGYTFFFIRNFDRGLGLKVS